MTFQWTLVCSECDDRTEPAGLPTVCPACGAPWLVRYHRHPAPQVRSRLDDLPWTMWRYREWLQLLDGEEPLTLGEGGTPLLHLQSIGEALGMPQLLLKDESQNPTGSFKARGLSAALTRAIAGGVSAFTVPSAGNAGVALSAYAARARLPARVVVPRSTPLRILEQIERFGGSLQLLDGHIGDCGKASRAHAVQSGAFDISTLREPYRIEGKKTLGLEIAEQLGWSMPDAILYPTGGGTGLIGMWIAFRQLRDAGWVNGKVPRLYSVQSTGCAPVVRAFEDGSERTEPWENPETVAAGLRVPAPLGGRLILRGIRDTGGQAVAVDDPSLVEAQDRLTRAEGVDMGPEGGATLAALEQLLSSGAISRDETVVLCNTGAGWLYER